MAEQELDKLSYALGMSTGNNFRNSGITGLNIQDFTDAISAVYYDAPLKMTYQEAKQVIQEFFIALQKKQEEEAAQAGKAFLEENGKRVEVKTTPSGLQYEVVKEGDGPKPGPTDKVKVHYTGTLLDGTVFDSSVERGNPISFGVNQVIPGWTEALQLMSVGSKWRLFIPSALAYGAQGVPNSPIGPNSTLIFDVELLGINE